MQRLKLFFLFFACFTEIEGLTIPPNDAVILQPEELEPIFHDTPLEEGELINLKIEDYFVDVKHLESGKHDILDF